MIDALQLLIYGIVLGCILALGAIGVSLIFGILRFAHFAHGDMMTLGAYLAYLVVVTLKLPFVVGIVVAVVGTAATVIVMDWAFYSRLRRSPGIILLISSVGVALIMRSLVQIVWGSSNRVYDVALDEAITFAGLRIQPDQLTIMGGTIILVATLHYFLQYTRLGKAMRAMSDNADLARISGINTDRVVLLTWVIAGVLAAAAGIFLGLDTRLHPTMGWHMLLPVFAAAIFGGIGKPYGAIVGALVIGIAMEMSTMFIPSAYKAAVAFAIMVAMLIWRPTGLFGGKVL